MTLPTAELIILYATGKNNRMTIALGRCNQFIGIQCPNFVNRYRLIIRDIQAWPDIRQTTPFKFQCDFAGRFGPRFYGLAENEERIVLERSEAPVPATYDLGASEVVPFRAGASTRWSRAVA